MANVTGGGDKGWRESIAVFGVFTRCANEHMSPAPVLLYTTEAEASSALDNALACAYGWDKNRVVAGCVREGRTIKGSGQIESIKSLYSVGTLNKPMPGSKPE